MVVFVVVQRQPMLDAEAEVTGYVLWHLMAGLTALAVVLFLVGTVCWVLEAVRARA
jgi:hypothetical protein